MFLTADGSCWNYDVTLKIYEKFSNITYYLYSFIHFFEKL